MFHFFCRTYNFYICGRRYNRKSLVILAILSLVIFSAKLIPDTAPSLAPEPEIDATDAQAISDAFPLPNDLPTNASALHVDKHIHFMYRSYQLDNKLKEFLASWRKVYPEYKLYFWTDKEINELVRRRYPNWEHLHHSQLSNYLERSDTARAFVLNAMGGWYSDVDASSLRRADAVAEAHALILPLEPYLHAIGNFRMRRLVSNAIMYSRAGHPFWMYYLHRLRDSLTGRRPRQSTLEAAFVTGPVLLTKVALHFIQAHTVTGSCRRGRWCPYLAPPVQFLSTYDPNNVPHMRRILKIYCAYNSDWHPEFSADCARYRQHEFKNHINTSESFTYHAFMHMNERVTADVTQQGPDTSDVRRWGLGLTVGNNILADLAMMMPDKN